MKMTTGMRAVAVTMAGALATASTLAQAACEADTGNTRAALVELYTSEGCSSCPPADRALTALARQRGAPRIVPLALHVDYWDSIGWKDRFAQPGFATRQQWEVRANRHRTSFTPHFFVNGREVLDWRADLDANLRRDPGTAPVRLKVLAEPRGGDRFHLVVGGMVAAAMPAHRPLQLYVAVTESGLDSDVDAGENRGVHLQHDAVVRNWIGPVAVQGDNVSIDRVVSVPQLSRGYLSVVAFIQDADTAEVLQAVDTGICKAG